MPLNSTTIKSRTNMTTLYGFQNVCFHPAANPKPRYYLTRAVRDKALANLRSFAVERGLAKSASIAGIYPVQRRTQDERLIEDAHENENEALSEEVA
jgi:hypothetical protein